MVRSTKQMQEKQTYFDPNVRPQPGALQTDFIRNTGGTACKGGAQKFQKEMPGKNMLTGARSAEITRVSLRQARALLFATVELGSQQIWPCPATVVVQNLYTALEMKWGVRKLCGNFGARRDQVTTAAPSPR